MIIIFSSIPKSLGKTKKAGAPEGSPAKRIVIRVTACRQGTPAEEVTGFQRHKGFPVRQIHASPLHVRHPSFRSS
ncbi:MAG: hypothetical protein KBD19_02515 [Candidatus Moranbacteria bacterium]|nr:hypothetical protein [Candidatus Moranbacteria bacterium]